MKVFKELVKLVELPSKHVVTLIGEELKSVPAYQRNQMIEALYVVARSQLNEDYRRTPKNAKIGRRLDKELDGVVSVLQITKSADGDYHCAMEFGSHANPQAFLRQALAHWCEVLSILEEEL